MHDGDGGGGHDGAHISHTSHTSHTTAPHHPQGQHDAGPQPDSPWPPQDTHRPRGRRSLTERFLVLLFFLLFLVIFVLVTSFIVDQVH